MGGCISQHPGWEAEWWPQEVQWAVDPSSHNLTMPSSREGLHGPALYGHSVPLGAAQG